VSVRNVPERQRTVAQVRVHADRQNDRHPP
jgi:hypothetical protein